MLAISGTVVNASGNLTRRVVATHESESDRAHVRFSDLLMCADLTDLRIGRPLQTTQSRLLGDIFRRGQMEITAYCTLFSIWMDNYVFIFILRGGTCSLCMPTLRPASQAGPMRKPREGTSVVLHDTIRLT